MKLRGVYLIHQTVKSRYYHVSVVSKYFRVIILWHCPVLCTLLIYIYIEWQMYTVGKMLCLKFIPLFLGHLNETCYTWALCRVDEHGIFFVRSCPPKYIISQYNILYFSDVSLASKALEIVHGFVLKGRPVIIQYGRKQPSSNSK